MRFKSQHKYITRNRKYQWTRYDKKNNGRALVSVLLKAPIPVLWILNPKIKTNQNKQQYFTDNHYQ